MTDVSSRLLERAASPDAFTPPRAPEARAGKIASEELSRWIGPALTALAFAWLFWQPAVSLASEWWNNPDAGHGLLLFPVAIWLAWRAVGIRMHARSSPRDS